MEDTEEKAINDWERVVYRIMVEDIQNIAIERFGRELTDEEVQIVEDKFPDGIKLE